MFNKIRESNNKRHQLKGKEGLSEKESNKKSFGNEFSAMEFVVWISLVPIVLYALYEAVKSF